MRRGFRFALVAQCLVAPVTLYAQKSAPPAGGAFAAADRHADAAPPAVEQSVPALAAYLAQAGSDELSRARALYRWLTSRIEYDAAGFRSGNYGDVTPEGVLRRRAAVCQGYAELARALGTAMGLRIEIVSGWSKGYGYRPGETFDGPVNHAWNAVEVNGRWRLMDATWGAGYLDERMQFVRRFQEHYFLTPPASFIYDHLPAEPRWQLLERPVSAGEYVELAYLRPTFFLLGLGLGSHDRASLTASDRVRLTLATSRPVQVAAVLHDAATNARLPGAWGLPQRRGDSMEIHAAFPAAGSYVLRLFAKPLGAEGALNWIADYRIEATGGSADLGFPTVFTGFAERGVQLESPLRGTLAAGQAYGFRLNAPGAIDVAIVAGGQWTHFARAGELFTAEFSAVPGDINVYARYEAGGQHVGLLRYTGR